MNEIKAPPEAELIERLRKALPRGQSAISKVATLAGISEGRWRQLAKGYQQATSQTRIRATAPADTLARMARAVGASADQLRDVGRADAANELERMLNAPEPTSIRLLRISATAAENRSPEDVQFLHDWEEAHPRRPDPNLGVDEDGNWLPAETTFENWLRARNQLSTRVLHYARARGISFNAAEEELPHVQQMATDVASGTGRPWTPPWDPGAEFEEDDEPWKAEFWSYTEAVPSPFGDDGHIYQIGHTYDLIELRQKRELSAHADEMWAADARRQTAAYNQAAGPTRQIDDGILATGSGDLPASRDADDLTKNDPDPEDPIARAFRNVPAPGQRVYADDLTSNEPPAQDDLDLAARTAPPGYQPGQGEQGEAGDEELQEGL